MNKLLLYGTLFLMIFGYHSTLKSQCVTTIDSIVTFTYENKTYEIIKEKKTWENAKLCALERGGYLVEINSQTEQTKIWEELGIAGLQNNPYSTVLDGNGASYIWIGATDKEEEGKWRWTGSGTLFWEGNENGTLVAEQYENWGKTPSIENPENIVQFEPDNFDFDGDKQHVAAIGLTEWGFGMEGQWNDIRESNELYFIVEKDPVAPETTFSITTQPTTRITQTKAQLHGTIVNKDSLAIIERGFMYKPESGGEWISVLIAEETNTLKSEITELIPATKYEFYAFVKIAEETETRNSDTSSFTTRIEGSVTAISDSVGSKKPESVTAYGTMEGTPNEGTTIGFMWKKAGEQNTGTFKFPTAATEFKHRITGLTPNTEYIMWFFVGDEMGNEITFKTPNDTPYTVETNDAEIIQSEVTLSATITQKGTNVRPVYTFDYKVSDQGTWKSTGTGGAEFKIIVRQLESNKQYTFRAVVTTDDTTKVYGEEKTFTSPTILGIFEANENVTLSVYPNPATNYVNAKIQALEEPSELLLVNMVGQIVKRYDLPTLGEQEEFTLNIPVNDLTRGIYYIKVDNAVQKIMVQ